MSAETTHPSTRPPHDVDETATRRHHPTHAAETKIVPQRGGGKRRRRIATVATALLVSLLVGAVAFAITRPGRPAALRGEPPTVADGPALPPPSTAAPSPQLVPPPAWASTAAAATPADAARLLVHGDVVAAQAAYRALAGSRPAEPVFALLAERLEQAAGAHCDRLQAEGKPCE